MRHNIDPAITAALLGKGPFARRRWRPCWWRISFLTFTIGFWAIVAWAASTFLGSKG